MKFEFWSIRPNLIFKILFFQHSIKLIDVTEESINLIKAIQEICDSDNNWKNNFTFTHYVDIFKGKKTQKVVSHGKIYSYLTFSIKII